MNSFRVHILAADHTFYDGPCESLTIPAPDGQYGIWAGHANTICATVPGTLYLRVEGACYVGIGCLFLLYGFYRAVKRPGMSLVLTIISLGVRVALAYALAQPLGVFGIWISIPIGWLLADCTGYGYYLLRKEKLLPKTS